MLLQEKSYFSGFPMRHAFWFNDEACLVIIVLEKRCSLQSEKEGGWVGLLKVMFRYGRRCSLLCATDGGEGRRQRWVYSACIRNNL